MNNLKKTTAILAEEEGVSHQKPPEAVLKRGVAEEEARLRERELDEKRRIREQQLRIATEKATSEPFENPDADVR